MYINFLITIKPKERRALKLYLYYCNCIFFKLYPDKFYWEWCSVMLNNLHHTHMLWLSAFILWCIWLWTWVYSTCMSENYITQNSVMYDFKGRGAIHTNTLKKRVKCQRKVGKRKVGKHWYNYLTACANFQNSYSCYKLLQRAAGYTSIFFMLFFFSRIRLVELGKFSGTKVVF